MLYSYIKHAHIQGNKKSYGQKERQGQRKFVAQRDGAFKRRQPKEAGKKPK